MSRYDDGTPLTGRDILLVFAIVGMIGMAFCAAVAAWGMLP